MNSLILLRGLPGSGKSTLANLLAENNKYPIFSVDSFFTNPLTGEYKFEFDKNHLAYKACQQNTQLAMQNMVAKIFVDNTFTIFWELEPYFKLAATHNYTIFVVTVENYHNNKNTHTIDDEKIMKMAEKYKIKLF
jgi:predicted kinase